MIVAVFGDVHGNLPGMYGLCKNWEQEHRKKIDLVLQTGDMGLWKSFEQMDSATKRHYKKDESELGAAAYLAGKKTAPIETWFTHGNHENFSLLADNEGENVDPYGKIFFLATGAIYEFRTCACATAGVGKGKETVYVAALGGMEYRFGKYSIPSEQRIQKYLHPPSLEHLRKECPKVDVLLLHDAPLNKGLQNKFPTGSKRLTELIEAMQPRFAFYGHYDDPPEPFCLGSTLCAGTNFARARRIPNRDGAMGILRTAPTSNKRGWEFHFVEP